MRRSNGCSQESSSLVGRHAPSSGISAWSATAIVALAAIAASAWFMISEKAIAGEWGFSLDDSWIYVTFARNLATGHGYSFNVDQPISGATGPLHVFVLSALYWVFKSVVIPAKLFGVCCLAVSSIVVERTARRILPDGDPLPLFAGLLTALSPALVWGALSGMELPLYLLLLTVGAYYYIRGRWPLAVLMWSVGVWARPDGILLVLIGVLVRPGLTRRSVIRLALVALVPISLLLLFDYSVGHSLLPNSVGVKTSLGGDVVAREWSMATQWLWLWGLSLRPDRLGLHAPLLIPAMITGAILLWRRSPGLVVYACFFPFAFGLIGPSGGQHGRYIAYVVPITILLACVGVRSCSQRGFGQHARRGAVLLAVICVVWEVNAGRYMASAHGWDVQNINGMQRYLAVTASKATAPGDTIAVNDVGAMGYFSRCYVVDLDGLVSHKRSFPRNLSYYHPGYLIVFPQWFQRYTKPDPQSGQTVFYSGDSLYKYVPILGVRLQTNVISSRSTMYVFQRRRPSDPANDPVKLITH